MNYLEFNSDDKKQFGILKGKIDLFIYYIFLSLEEKRKNENLTQKEKYLFSIGGVYLFETRERKIENILNELKSKIDLTNLNDFETEISSFFQKFNINILINYLKPEKSNLCFDFVFRVIYEKTNIKLNIEDLRNDQYFTFIGSIQENQSIYEIGKDIEIGDVIFYYDNNEINHIGFICSENLSVLSKEGNNFLWKTPYNALNNDFTNTYGRNISIIRFKNSSFNNYFKSDFMKKMERMETPFENLIKITKEVLKELEN